jgi:hypothetical protein
LASPFLSIYSNIHSCTVNHKVFHAPQCSSAWFCSYLFLLCYPVSHVSLPYLTDSFRRLLLCNLKRVLPWTLLYGAACKVLRLSIQTM